MEREALADAEHRTSPSGSVVHQAILNEGETELDRSTGALLWSGLAAGLSMGFTFIAVSLLHAHTPHAKWQPLVTSLGYPLGFLIVVLGRQQLFTENTLTVVLPLLRHKRASILVNVARVWTMVLLANAIGAMLVAFVLAKTDAVSEETFESMKTVAAQAHQATFAITFLRGIFAGWLIALMVWLLPFAESARVWVIFALTYFVGLGHLSHIVAGTVDASFLVFVRESTWSEFAAGFFIPALLGNIAGGVLLVASLNHAQASAS